MSSIYDQRYIKLVEHLIQAREKSHLTQVKLARKLGIEQSTVSKIENFDRRLDVVELFDWLAAIEHDPLAFLREVGWIDEEDGKGTPALPVPGKATPYIVNDADAGTIVEMAWHGERRQIVIENMPVDGYLALESKISQIFKSLNDGKGGKNRDAIRKALEVGFYTFPDVNPSDIYHHIVYRIYLREYTKTQADRSWVRAGGEAVELFLQRHYNQVLEPIITLRWLSNSELKLAALHEMGIQEEVGGSKLDIALYGKLNGRQVLFGGIHVKASLAERVSDDVPCSEAMIRKGFSSYLLTFDAKSYPPPGDLVNRGEFGTPNVPSDKRAYIESHGSFSACYCYNLRSTPSGEKTSSGKKIFVSTFSRKIDPFPQEIKRAWETFLRRL